MGDQSAKFESFFSAATGQAIEPFPFQRDFALASETPMLVNIPTGLGKTAMAVVGWLWRRNGGNNELKAATPRRLVYCLPMRVLVEQTRECAKCWVAALRKADLVCGDVPVHVLMGGEEKNDWDVHPERDAIIIGTQDMLLSRALNRGYAASRARWPMHFGLLNTDCLWVFDEIQLMGSGLATTAQLEAFRRWLPHPDSETAKAGHGCRSVWMSATMRPEWLNTVDFKNLIDALPRLKLEAADHDNDELCKRWNATKPLIQPTPNSAAMGDAVTLADEIRKAHKPGTRTIVVVNTVKRACELCEKIAAPASGDTPALSGGKKAKAGKKGLAVPDTAPTPLAALPKIVLLHSRFRPDDRKKAVDVALAAPTTEGTIVVSTQIIEAGVDVSATTLFTELAPWASLVQRFGRCNRKGEENANAAVHWIDLPAKDADAEKLRFPYELPDLRATAEQLEKLEDVGLGSLAMHRAKLNDEEVKSLFPHAHTHVIRRKDLIDLFDTTPDLAGNDIDIDRYVREIEETDVRVFWRSWDGDVPTDDEPQPTREELCPAPIGDFKKFVVKENAKGKVFRRDFLEGKWIALDSARIAPGQVYMIRADAGGYVTQCGWDASSPTQVEPLPRSDERGTDPDGYDDDSLSRTSRWQTIAQHTDDVCRELDSILRRLGVSAADPVAANLRDAARWHDWGKAHAVFQAVLPSAAPDAGKHWAKADGTWKRYRAVGRPHFRHELASALAVLQKSVPLKSTDRDLVAYLIAAHHGKVRLSIRSFPDEKRPKAENGTPQPQERFARGVWEGDSLPAADLGGGVNAPAVALSLEPMELGLCESPPFAGEPSWIERVLRLRDDIGPFRLAYLEAVLRAADERASAATANGKGAANA